MTMTFDDYAATQAREQAIAEVTGAMAIDWAARALYAAHQCAQRNLTFIVDDVWAFMAAVDVPREPRAMGAIIRRAVQKGWISGTSEYRPSSRVTAHKNPRRVWQSLIVVELPAPPALSEPHNARFITLDQGRLLADTATGRINKNFMRR